MPRKRTGLEGDVWDLKRVDWTDVGVETTLPGPSTGEGEGDKAELQPSTKSVEKEVEREDAVLANRTQKASGLTIKLMEPPNKGHVRTAILQAFGSHCSA